MRRGRVDAADPASSPFFRSHIPVVRPGATHGRTRERMGRGAAQGTRAATTRRRSRPRAVPATGARPLVVVGRLNGGGAEPPAFQQADLTTSARGSRGASGSPLLVTPGRAAASHESDRANGEAQLGQTSFHRDHPYCCLARAPGLGQASIGSGMTTGKSPRLQVKQC